MIYLHKTVFQSHGYLSSYLSNHTVTCPVLTVTWTADGSSRSLDSHCTRSDVKTTEMKLVKVNDLFWLTYCWINVLIED